MPCSEKIYSKFILNNVCYVYFSEAGEDMTNIKNIYTGDVLYTVDSSRILRDRAGVIGYFVVDSDGLISCLFLSGIKIDTGNTCALLAELEVFKYLLEL